MKKVKKSFKRIVKKVSSREVLTKVVVVISSLALLSSAVLPFIIR